MRQIQTALLYSEWALEFLIVPPTFFAFLIAAVSFIWAGQKQRPCQTRLWQPHHWLVLTHLLFFVAAIAIGVRWPANPSLHHESNRTAKFCLDAVWYGSFASCVFWIWRMRGFRWYAASLIALAELPTWGAVLVAGMSITGNWL